jgi:hypothetical protein
MYFFNFVIIEKNYFFLSEKIPSEVLRKLKVTHTFSITYLITGGCFLASLYSRNLKPFLYFRNNLTLSLLLNLALISNIRGKI